MRLRKQEYCVWCSLGWFLGELSSGTTRQEKCQCKPMRSSTSHDSRWALHSCRGLYVSATGRTQQIDPGSQVHLVWRLNWEFQFDAEREKTLFIPLLQPQERARRTRKFSYAPFHACCCSHAHAHAASRALELDPELSRCCCSRISADLSANILRLQLSVYYVHVAHVHNTTTPFWSVPIDGNDIS